MVYPVSVSIVPVKRGNTKLNTNMNQSTHELFTVAQAMQSAGMSFSLTIHNTGHQWAVFLRDDRNPLASVWIVFDSESEAMVSLNAINFALGKESN